MPLPPPPPPQVVVATAAMSWGLTAAAYLVPLSPPPQVVVATAAMSWGLTAAAYLVVIMGTQYFEASGSGASDYPVTDLLQMMGRASRPNIDDAGKGGGGGGPLQRH